MGMKENWIFHCQAQLKSKSKTHKEQISDFAVPEESRSFVSTLDNCKEGEGDYVIHPCFIPACPTKITVAYHLLFKTERKGVYRVITQDTDFLIGFRFHISSTSARNAPIWQWSVQPIAVHHRGITCRDWMLQCANKEYVYIAFWCLQNNLPEYSSGIASC